MNAPPTRDVPVLALDVQEACQAYGISWKLWRAEVEPHVKIVRLGRRKLVSVTELQRFLDDHAEAVGS
jgi:hypothetical protein